MPYTNIIKNIKPHINNIHIIKYYIIIELEFGLSGIVLL